MRASGAINISLLRSEEHALSVHQIASRERFLKLQGNSSFLAQHWGDIASVVGVFISLVGFAVTIWGVLRSKSAAQRAESAADAARKSILRSDTLMELSASVTMMEEIKRLHRASAWSVLPDRYSILKSHLVSIRTSNPTLKVEHQAALQSAILQFGDMEKRIEKTISGKSGPPSVATLNEIVSAQVNKINEILAVLKQDIEV